MKHLKSINEFEISTNESIKSNLAKIGLMGALMMPIIPSARSIDDKVKTEIVINKEDGVEVKDNIRKISEIRKTKCDDKELSKILSEIEENLYNNDTSKYKEMFNKLSNHIENKYGFKINKDIEKLDNAGISELKSGESKSDLISIIGWIGAVCLALCGVPQAWMSHKDKHSHGISWSFLLLWAFGELFALLYVYDKLDLPLLLNYSINILILGVILYYKIKPGSSLTN